MDTITKLENEIKELRKVLNVKSNQLIELKQHCEQIKDSEQNGTTEKITKLPVWAIERYSRQIILSDIGVQGQIALCNSKVLIIGVGGLGCPAASYLAGAGVGTIGLVDYDTVDVSNIHRQTLHSESDQGVTKVQSAANYIQRTNSNIKVNTYNVQLESKNALEIISGYDLVLDCTDNVPSRYLISDACVLAKVPLISGSALKMEGQLTIYNYTCEDYKGPCYRCLFPTPPPAASLGSCSTSGVCGAITGVIGSLQALEAIKLIVGFNWSKLLAGRMLLFDGEDMAFRTVKLRPRNVSCAICSDHPALTELIDYEQFCNAQAQEKDPELKILPPENRMQPEQFEKLYKDRSLLLIDVRSAQEFHMCSLDGAVNYPIEKFERNEGMQELVERVKNSDGIVTFICRRGNDSQLVCDRVLNELDTTQRSQVRDLIGGLHAWSRHTGHSFPIY